MAFPRTQLKPKVVVDECPCQLSRVGKLKLCHYENRKNPAGYRVFRALGELTISGICGIAGQKCHLFSSNGAIIQGGTILFETRIDQSPTFTLSIT